MASRGASIAAVRSWYLGHPGGLYVSTATKSIGGSVCGGGGSAQAQRSVRTLCGRCCADPTSLAATASPPRVPAVGADGADMVCLRMMMPGCVGFLGNIGWVQVCIGAFWHAAPVRHP